MIDSGVTQCKFNFQYIQSVSMLQHQSEI